MLTPTPIGITFQQPKRSCRREKGGNLRSKSRSDSLSHARNVEGVIRVVIARGPEFCLERLDHARAKVARRPKFRLLSLLCFASNRKMTLKFSKDLVEISKKLGGYFSIRCKAKE
eukprot:sb/3476712/